MNTTSQCVAGGRLAALALGAGALLAAVAPASAQLTRAFTAFPNSLTNEIKYVIIIYPENQSFDALYGSFPGANNLSNAVYYTQYGRSNSTPLSFLPQPNLNGVSLLNLPTAASSIDPRFPSTLANAPYDAAPYVPDNYVYGDMTHKFYLEQYQINNYNWYTNDPKNAGGPPMSKYSVWGSNPGMSLHHYDEQNGAEGSLAKQFVLADNCFHSAFGGSFANHQFLIAARLPVWPTNPPEGGQPIAANTSITPVDPNSPYVQTGSGSWWPGATSADIGYGYGNYLSDNTLTPDPTLPGFPYSNANTNLNPGDCWALNTVYPLRGPAGGYAAPAGPPYLNLPTPYEGFTPTVVMKTANGSNSVFTAGLTYAPISFTVTNSRLPLQTYDTIGDRLNAAGVSWAWFSGGWDNAKNGTADFLFQFHHQPFAYFTNYALAQSPQYPLAGSTNDPIPGVDSYDTNGAPVGYGIGSANHLLDEDADFYRMLDAGTLPHVSFVKPIGEDNSHPGYASIKRGQAWMGNIVSRIKNSKLWPQTVIFICYDEHGGQWDHVVPPVIDRWGPGTRIPFIIVSPFSKKGYVDHNQYETVSMLSFIEDLYNLTPLNTRDANALPPVAAFLGQPDLFLESKMGQQVSYQVPAYNNPNTYSWTGNTDGLTMSSSGLITGTPISTGSYTATISVTSKSGLAGAVVKYTLQIDVH